MLKFLLFPYFLFFWLSNMIFSDALILHVSQLQIQQVITSLTRSHIEYLTQTYCILVLILQSKLTALGHLVGICRLYDTDCNAAKLGVYGFPIPTSNNLSRWHSNDIVQSLFTGNGNSRQDSITDSHSKLLKFGMNKMI